MATTRTFRVVSHAKLYGGWWQVLRDDGRIMHAAQRPNQALHWINTWGDSVGQVRAGQPASHRLLTTLGLPITEPEPEPIPFNDDF